MVLAPEHPLVDKIAAAFGTKQTIECLPQDHCAQNRSRQAARRREKEKTGVA
jgi:hypothetical protein